MDKQKGNLNWKRLLITLGIVIVTTVVIGGVTWYLMDQQAKNEKTANDKQVLELQKQIDDLQKIGVSTPSDKSGIVISTDKTEYKKGEIISIVVNNKLDQPILHFSGPGRFWGIEYFKDGKWAEFGYKDSTYQVSEAKIGNTCNLALYERALPEELKSGANISGQWKQIICLLPRPANINTLGIVRYIEGGHYRFTFSYGFEVSKDNPDTISDLKTVYSNSFTIK